MSVGTALFKTNMRVRHVERAGSKDRYGKANLETVATDLRIRLERRTQRTRSPQGDVVTIDGTMMVGPKFDLITGDVATLSNGERWVVFNVDESLDINGKVLFKTYGLTRQRP